MKATARIALVDKISRELQSRYRFDEIDTFVGTYGVKPLASFSVNSKWAYSKALLGSASDETILKIAEELDITAPLAARNSGRPRNWQDPIPFRLFISHVSKDKAKATRLKECFAPFGVSAFVAHEDIKPTLEWQHEIERALATMDAMVAIHTTGFAASNWTQQEVGFALGRAAKIISLKMGEDPTGFISRHQALALGSRRAEVIAQEIVDLLKADDRTSARMTEATSAMIDEEDVPF